MSWWGDATGSANLLPCHHPSTNKTTPKKDPKNVKLSFGLPFTVPQPFTMSPLAPTSPQYPIIIINGIFHSFGKWGKR